MNWYAVFAIYFLMWVICAFIMLPFGPVSYTHLTLPTICSV